jgi:hypothetical protein
VPAPVVAPGQQEANDACWLQSPATHPQIPASSHPKWPLAVMPELVSSAKLRPWTRSRSGKARTDERWEPSQHGQGRSERKWWTLFAMCFALFMIMLDNTIVNVALPSIQRSLQTRVPGAEELEAPRTAARAEGRKNPEGSGHGDILSRTRAAILGAGAMGSDVDAAVAWRGDVKV